MSNISVDNLQGRIAAVVDQNEDVNDIPSSDYSLRLQYMNMALTEWAEIYDWQTLYKEYNSLVSTSSGNASIVLPSDFRKLASFPKITWDGSTTDEFPEVRPQEDGRYTDNDKRVNIFGNPYDGYILRVKGVELISGASVKVPYYSSPQSLASPIDVPQMPNPDYLVQRTVSYIWESREDARFPQAKVEAEKILRNMIEQENVFSEASTFGRIQSADERKNDFRWGRDG